MWVNNYNNALEAAHTLQQCTPYFKNNLTSTPSQAATDKAMPNPSQSANDKSLSEESIDERLYPTPRSANVISQFLPMKIELTTE